MRIPVIAVALALVTIGLVVFIFAELHTAQSPAATPSPAPPSPLPTIASPTPPTSFAPPPRPRLAPHPPVTPATAPTPSPPPAPVADTRVIEGRTRDQWRAYYDERRRRTLADLDRSQQIVDRATAGEEPDPTELGNAHVRIRELKADLTHDLEELQRLEAAFAADTHSAPP